MISLFRLIGERFQGMPWRLVLTAYLIIGFGLLNLYSSTDAFQNASRFWDQIVFVGLGTCVMLFLGLGLELKRLERLGLAIYIFICFLLLAVDIMGHSAKGAERWLVVGSVRIQPSEFAKFAIILMIARSFEHMRRAHEVGLIALWRQALWVAIPCLLILAQPDLGTASLIFLIALLQIATVRIPLRSVLWLSGVGLILGILAWNFVLYDYQKQRVLTFINPMRDPKGSGYHSLQSMIAVGSGGFWGQGFGQGSQTRLNFLPERHTDFAFSVWAEEHGFAGCIVLLALFCVFIGQIVMVSHKARDSFSTFVSMGVAVFFMCHMLINVSMVLGLFPVVGVPLSFVSYGGTHMITALACLGLVVAVERRRVNSFGA